MIRACAAVGGCNTARTLSRRWISCCRRAVCGLLMAISPLAVIPGSPKGRGPESMNTGLWKMHSGLAAARRPGMTNGGARHSLGPLGRDEAVDLAVAEHPAPALLYHLVVIGAAGADLRPGRAVLDDGPVRADIGGVLAVEGDHDIGHEVDPARAVVAGPGADVAGQRGDRLAAGRLAEGGLPGAVLGEQCRHPIIPTAVEPEAVLGQHLANGVFLFEHARHLCPPDRSSAAV